MKKIVKINNDWSWIVESDRYVYKDNLLYVSREFVEKQLKHLRNPSQTALIEELNKILGEWLATQKYK